MTCGGGPLFSARGPISKRDQHAPKDQSLAPLLTAWVLRDPNRAVRGSAAFILAQIGKTPEAVNAVCQACRADPDASVRKAATRGLAKAGAKAENVKVVVTTLSQAVVGDKSEAVRLAAAEALGQLGPPAKDAAPALMAAKSDSASKVARRRR